MQVAEPIINGRRVRIPAAATGRQILAAGGIDPGRRLIRRTREGNYLVKPDDQVHVDGESIFVDAPQRAKGGM